MITANSYGGTFSAQRFVLDGANEALNDGDAALLADGAETRTDPVPSTPSPVVITKLERTLHAAPPAHQQPGQ